MLSSKAMGAGGVGGGGAPEIKDFVTDTSFNSATTGSFTFGGDLDVAAGDLMLLFGCSDLTLSWSASGWSTGYTYDAFNGSSSQYLFYKTASSSDGTTTLSYSPAPSGPVGNVANLATLVSISGGTFGGVNTTSPTLTRDPPSITITDGGMLLAILNYQDLTPEPTVTPPSGYTLGNSLYVNNTSYNRIQGCAFAYDAPLSGSQDPGAFGGVTDTWAFYAASVAIDPV